jgi:hypothetical protein
VSSRLPYRVNVAAAAHGPGAQHDVCAANNRVTSSPQLVAFRASIRPGISVSRSRSRSALTAIRYP